MKFCTCIAFFLCIVVESKSESTALFKGIVGPHLEECRSEVEFTEDDFEHVLNLEPSFSPQAKCLIACCMRKQGMIRDGRLTPPEEFVVPYKEMYADVPERMEDPLGVVSTCYEEVTKQQNTNPCEIGPAMIGCTKRIIYGASEK